MSDPRTQRNPGGWRIHGWRSKGRGRRVTAASMAGQEHDKWIVRYNPWSRDAARMKLRAIDENTPAEFVAALREASAEFVPYRRERRFRAPGREPNEGQE